MENELKAPGLSPAQAQRVLRYWLHTVRHEEALSARIKAQPVAQDAPPPNLYDPQKGIGYTRFETSAGLEDFLACREAAVRLPCTAPLHAFLETWLWWQQRLDRTRSQKHKELAVPMWMVGFPVLYFEKKKEIACPIRFETQIHWFDDADKPWQPPTAMARRAGLPVALPASVQLSRSAAGPDEAPYSLDLSLLSRGLGLGEAHISHLIGLLAQATEASAPQLLAQISALLATPQPPDLEDSPAQVGARSAEEGAQIAPVGPAALGEAEWAALFAAGAPLLLNLCDAFAACLPPGVRVFPYALLFEGSNQSSSYYLQQDLVHVLHSPLGQSPYGRQSALWPWLSGHAPQRAAEAPLWAYRRAQGLTAQQRQVAQRFLGSTLTAVQGPPGTGKTELILSLAAHQLVERMLKIAHGPPGALPHELLVVCSTNNRAVDQVVDPLGPEMPERRLPLALRVGSRQVVFNQTCEQLERVCDWLRAQRPEGAEAALHESLQTLRDLHERWAQLSGAERRRVEQTQRLAEARLRLRAVRAELRALDEPAGPPPDEAQVEALRRGLLRLRTWATRLPSEGAVSPHAVLRSWRDLRVWARESVWPAVSVLPLSQREALDRLLEVGASERWDDAAQETCEELLEVAEEIEEALNALLDREARPQQLRAERAALKLRVVDLEAQLAQPAVVFDASAERALMADSYAAALDAREHWAIAHREPLLRQLRAAIHQLRGQPSVQRLFQEESAQRAWLGCLFPVWGCTLLSLGNVFPQRGQTIERLVIDEAGQCHPAYAVSALMRARQVLCIGDVHQLEPVVELSESDEARLRQRYVAELDDAQLAPYRVYSEARRALGQPQSGPRPGGSSAQRLADRAVETRLSLHDHFRCQPEIIALCDQLCDYQLTVHTPRRSFQAQLPLLSQPALFFPVLGAQSGHLGSWKNDAELHWLMQVLARMDDAQIAFEQVAIITPYVGQLDAVRRAIGARRFRGSTRALALGTVHRFQGGERPIVLFSTVVSQLRSLPFIDGQVNLLNVAISRAMDHLLVCGHAPTLSQGLHTRLLVHRLPHVGAG